MKCRCFVDYQDKNEWPRRSNFNMNMKYIRFVENYIDYF